MSVHDLPLPELKDIRRSLFGAESTMENLRKIEAIEAQIIRVEKETQEGTENA